MAEDRQSDPDGMTGLPKVVANVELSSTAKHRTECFGDVVNAET
jgi:hypothetical protein